VKEITKLEKTSLSDFTLCGAELLPKQLMQLEESASGFFRPCTDSLIVCADCVGMSGSVKGMKFLEESLARFFRPCTNSLIVCAAGGMARSAGVYL